MGLGTRLVLNISVLQKTKQNKKKIGDLAEQQRALATLGRTYFVYSQSEEEKGKPNTTDLLNKAEKNYNDSLEVCNKLVSLVSDKEVLEMRSRLYLNLGLVYETRMELQSARSSMEKALNILRLDEDLW